MVKFRNLLLVVVFIAGFAISALAGDHPQANYGIYGIQHFTSVAQYRKTYVGQVVQYLPKRPGGGNMDKKYFQAAGGKFYTDYVVLKISGNNKRMTWVLVEKGTKNKVKMIVNNQDEDYSFDKYCYCITDSFSIPLFLSEKFKSDQSNYIGKVYPEKPQSPIKLEVSNIFIQPQKGSSYSDHRYPQVCLVVKDQSDGKTYNFDVANIGDINDLGRVFTNPKFRCSYTVVNVFNKMENDTSYKFYTVKNSIDGTTKTVKATDAQSEAFKNDDSGKIVALLTKVEKPSNPIVKYGIPTIITEDGITKFSFEDYFIRIVIFADTTQFFFSLINVSDNTLKVVWNEAVFVDVDGSTSKVMHAGIKYFQREGDQVASPIIAGAKLVDTALPIDKVYYSDTLKKWTSKPLYSYTDTQLKGKTIKLMLPIQVWDVINDYVFEFTLNYKYDHPEYMADVRPSYYQM